MCFVPVKLVFLLRSSASPYFSSFKKQKTKTKNKVFCFCFQCQCYFFLVSFCCCCCCLFFVFSVGGGNLNLYITVIHPFGDSALSCLTWTSEIEHSVLFYAPYSPAQAGPVAQVNVVCLNRSNSNIKRYHGK